MRQKPDGISGFTLVEIMVALSVLTIGVLGIGTLTNSVGKFSSSVSGTAEWNTLVASTARAFQDEVTCQRLVQASIPSPFDPLNIATMTKPFDYFTVSPGAALPNPPIVPGVTRLMLKADNGALTSLLDMSTDPFRTFKVSSIDFTHLAPPTPVVINYVDPSTNQASGNSAATFTAYPMKLVITALHKVIGAPGTPTTTNNPLSSPPIFFTLYTGPDLRVFQPPSPYQSQPCTNVTTITGTVFGCSLPQIYQQNQLPTLGTDLPYAEFIVNSGKTFFKCY